MREFCLFTILVLSGPCYAQMPVEVVSSGDDIVGKQLVYRVKEAIRSSTSMVISLADTTARMQVHLVTLEYSEESPGYSTAYSVVMTLKIPDQLFPYYLNQYTGYCGVNRVQACADGIVADVSETADEIIKMINQLVKD